MDDGSELLERIDARLEEEGIRDHGGYDEQHRVAVGGGFRRGIVSDVAACAGAVLDDARLCDPLGELRRHDARHHVGGPAGWKRHDPAHRFGRP